MQIEIYEVIGFFVATMSLVMGAYVFGKNPKRRVNRIYGFVSVLIALWSFGYTMTVEEIMGGDLNYAILYYHVYILGVSFLPSAWLHLSLTYRMGEVLKSRLFLIYGFAVFFLFFLTTESFYVEDGKIALTINSMFWIFLAIVYFMIFFGLHQYFLAYKKTQNPVKKKQALIMIFGALIPVSGNIAFNIVNIRLSFDVTIPLFLIGGLVIAYGILKLKIFEGEMIPSDLIMREMGEGVFVIDEEKKIQYGNQAFKSMFGGGFLQKSCYEVFGMEELCKNCILERSREKSAEFEMDGNCYIVSYTPISHYNEVTKEYEKYYLGVVRDITEVKKSHKILSSLNLAITEIQKALSQEEIFKVVGEELKKFGFGTVVLLRDGDNLKVEYASFHYPLLEVVEKIIGKKVVGYSFPIKKSKDFRNVLKNKKTYFVKNPEKNLAAIIPSARFTSRIAKILSLDKNILSPLVVKGECIGILSVTSKNLEEKDVDVISIFANQISTSLENAKLYTTVKESEEKYRNLIESSLFGIAISQEGRIVFANKAFLDIFGYKSFDEINGKNIEIFIAPEDREMVLERARRREEGEDIVSNYEFKGLRKDGEKIDIEIFSKKIFLKGKPAIQTSFRDITEKKKIEKELRESEKRYRNLFENVNDAIFFLAKDGCFPITNPKTTELTGYSQEELKRTHFTKLVHPEDLDMMVEGFRNVMSGKYAPEHYEFRVVRKDGKIVDVEGNFRRQEKDGEIIGTLCVLRDVTERKEMENKLKTLYQLGQELELSLDLDEISEKVLDACQKVLDFKMIAIFLIDKETQELYIKAQKGYPEEFWNFRLSLKGERGITTWVAKNGKPVIVPDVLKDSRYVEGDSRVKSELAVPIKFRGKVLGVLNAESEELDAYDEKDLELLQTLASYTAAAMENAKLFEEIKNTKDYLENIVESAAEAIIALDTKGRILTFNRGAEIIMGYKAQDVIGKSVLNYYPEGVAKKVMKELRKSKDGKIVDYETSVLGKNNEEIPISLCATLLYNAEGKVIGSLGVFRDLREKKEMEEKINAIYELSRKMALEIDVKKIAETTLKILSEVLHFNNCAFLMVDREKKELYTIARIGFPNNVPYLRLPLNSEKGIVCWVARNGTAKNIPDVSKDKRYYEEIPTIKSNLAVPIKFMEKVLGVIDVEGQEVNQFTEEDQKMVEILASQVAIAIENAKLYENLQKESKRLKKSNKELELLQKINNVINSTLDLDKILQFIVDSVKSFFKYDVVLITLLDDDSKNLVIKSVSIDSEKVKKIEKFTGLTVKGFKIPLFEGSMYTELIRKGESVIVTRDLKKALEDFSDKKSLRRLAGGVSRILGGKYVVAIPLKSQEKIIGTIGIALKEKITEEEKETLKRFAEQVGLAVERARLFEEVKKSENLKDLFISVLSHDLKNPLQIIQGYSEILKSKDSSSREFLETIENSAKRMNKLIEDARQYAKLRGKFEKDFMELDLGGILMECVSEFSEKALEKNIKIELNIKKNSLIFASPQIKNVFINLIDNAIKYSPENSKIEIGIEDKKKNWLIYVKDYGIGVSDEFKETIFEKFERTDKSSGIRGSGLGLAIVKEIVKLHNGKVWVEDNPEGGSIFFVELPKNL